MSFEITATAQALADKTLKTPQLILEIEGIDLIFGSIDVLKSAEYGDDIVYGEAGLVYGGTTADPNSRPYISLTGGTTTNIKQQIDIDKASSSSVQKMAINLVDKNQEVSNIMTPGITIDDILGRRANVYLGFAGGAFPADAIRILNGRVTDLEIGSTNVKLLIAHPENDTRQEIFRLIQTKITAEVDDVETTFELDNVTGIIANDAEISTYFLIGDEIVSLDSLTGTTATVTRGLFGTIPATHEIDTELETRYSFTENPIIAALKMQLSGASNDIGGVEIENFEDIDDVTNIQNAILIHQVNLQDKLGLSEGDFITITGAANGANNVTNAEIISFTANPGGTVVQLTGVSLIEETTSDAIASFKSQYNVWPEGAGLNMSTDQVDVQQYLDIFNNTGFSFPDINPFLTDTINGKEYISEIFFPVGLYVIPRKGRTSLNITRPNFGVTKTFNKNNIARPDSIVIKRRTSRYFYNRVVYKFNPDYVDTNRYLAGEIALNEESFDRIGINSTLLINAGAYRDNAVTRTAFQNQAFNYLTRYALGAQVINLEVLYKDGFSVEVGDTALLDGTDLNIYSSDSGTRNFTPKIFEVINKELRITANSTRVSLTLLDTNFETNARYWTWGPASKIGVGSTVSVLVLKDSFGNVGNEREKWEDFIGEEIRIRNADFSYEEVTTITEFNGSNSNALNILPPLSGAPPEDYIVEFPNYDLGSDILENGIQKALHGFWNPQLTVVSGLSTSSFTVSAADAARVVAGQPVRIHSDDFTVNSNPEGISKDPTVADVTGTTITLNTSIDFTPVAGYKVELVGFLDSGSPYRWV